MKNVLLASVAVVSLLSFTNAAPAQSMNQGGAKEAPPAASQKSEAPAHAPAAKPSVAQSATVPAPKAGAVVEEKATPKAAQHAQEKAAPKAQPDKAAADVKPDAKPSAATTAPAASTTAKDTKAPASSATTGAAASGPTAAAAAPPAEKRAQIVSAIKQEKVEAVTNVNFNISIGSMVPSTVRFYSVPSHIVTIYPEWSGYEYILVNGRYLIVRPRTHEIVYIIEG
jgi:hypothetical protein